MKDTATLPTGDVRQVLNAARMMLDRIANGHHVGGDEAGRLAQRIVDLIGHGPTDEEPARTVNLPAAWRLGAHGDPIAQFAHLHLRLNSDGAVTWFSDEPNNGSPADHREDDRG